MTREQEQQSGECAGQESVCRVLMQVDSKDAHTAQVGMSITLPNSVHICAWLPVRQAMFPVGGHVDL